MARLYIVNQLVTMCHGVFCHPGTQLHGGFYIRPWGYLYTTKVTFKGACYLVVRIYSLKNKKLYWVKNFSTELEMHIDPHSDPKAWG